MLETEKLDSGIDSEDKHFCQAVYILFCEVANTSVLVGPPRVFTIEYELSHLPQGWRSLLLLTLGSPTSKIENGR